MDNLLESVEDMVTTSGWREKTEYNNFGDDELNGWEVYIDDELMPIAPPNIKTKINNQNNTINLLNGQELNLINKPGLTNLDMNIRLPSHYEPHVVNFQPQQYYLDLFERLKLPKDEEEKYFSVVILRNNPNFELTTTYFKKMTLEDYELEEDYGEGYDIIVSLKLKQYIPPKEKIVDVKAEDDKGKATITKTVKKESDRPAAKGKEIKVEKGDTLISIAQRELGKSDRETINQIAKKNEIANPNLIKPGQKVVL